MELPKETRKAFIHLARIYETTGLEKIREACTNCIGKYGKVFGNAVACKLTGYGSESLCHLCKNIASCEDCWMKINGEKCCTGVNGETYRNISESVYPDDIRKAFISRAKHIRTEIRKCEEREE